MSTLRNLSKTYANGGHALNDVSLDIPRGELVVLTGKGCAEDPPADGTDGQNAFCFDNPDADRCQPKQGVQGISVIGMRFERTDAGDCVLAELLRNPANGEDSVVRVPVPAQMCGVDEPAPPETTTEAPGGGLLPGG